MRWMLKWDKKLIKQLKKGIANTIIHGIIKS